jgi:hypothetical protein
VLAGVEGMTKRWLSEEQLIIMVRGAFLRELMQCQRGCVGLLSGCSTRCPTIVARFENIIMIYQEMFYVINSSDSSMRSPQSREQREEKAERASRDWQLGVKHFPPLSFY